MLDDRGEARCRGSPRGTGREAAPRSARGDDLAYLSKKNNMQFFHHSRRPDNPRKNARLRNAAHRILPGITYETYEETTLRGSTPRRGTQKNNQQKTKTMENETITHAEIMEMAHNAWKAVHTYDTLIIALTTALKREKNTVCRGSYRYSLNLLRREQDTMRATAEWWETCAEAVASKD